MDRPDYCAIADRLTDGPDAGIDASLDQGDREPRDGIGDEGLAQLKA